MFCMGSDEASAHEQEWVQVAQRGKELWQTLKERGGGKSEVCPLIACPHLFIESVFILVR